MKTLIVFVFSFFVLNYAQAIEIRIPITSHMKTRDSYQLGLLKLAMEKSKVPFTLVFRKKEWTQKRIVSMLRQGKAIDLYWIGTSKELEKTLLPVRIPLYRGLLGHRIFIIHKKDQSRFDAVNTLDDLRQMKAVQGSGWTDIDILKTAGLKTYANKYKNIFKMINRGGKIDYFPRGVMEAFGEIWARQDKYPNLAIEKHVLLVYPFAMFFFVSPSNPKLAKTIELGLKLAYEDGSFEKYLKNDPSIQAIFRKSNLDNRVRLEIDNPLLSTETIAIPSKYWYKSKN